MNVIIEKMQSPEAKYQQLFEAMYQLCEENNWGDPFSYARSREIHLASILGHRVSDTLSGADAYDENNLPVEYKSTIGKKLTATYNGISVQNTWEDQVKYLQEDKIGKYHKHFFARYHLGKVVEVWVMNADDVLRILIDNLERQFKTVGNKKDPRLGYTISNKLIQQFGTKVL